MQYTSVPNLKHSFILDAKRMREKEVLRATTQLSLHDTSIDKNPYQSVVQHNSELRNLVTKQGTKKT